MSLFCAVVAPCLSAPFDCPGTRAVFLASTDAVVFFLYFTRPAFKRHDEH